MTELTLTGDVTELAKAIAKEVAKVLGDKTETSDTSDDQLTQQDVIDLCKEIGPEICKPILKAAGFRTLKSLVETELDDDEIVELYTELKEVADEDATDEDATDEDDEESEEIDIETVKKAVQAFAKKNGKEEADEILEEFEIKSVRSLKKLDAEQLEELYEAVTE